MADAFLDDGHRGQDSPPILLHFCGSHSQSFGALQQREQTGTGPSVTDDTALAFNFDLTMKTISLPHFGHDMELITPTLMRIMWGHEGVRIAFPLQEKGIQRLKSALPHLTILRYDSAAY